MYQVKWFSKKKGYGFVEDESQKQYFVHHTDIQVSDGFRYLKEGEYIKGVEEKMEGDKLKIASIQAPMTNGKLMCEVERRPSSKSRASGEEEDAMNSESVAPTDVQNES